MAALMGWAGRCRLSLW